MILLQNESIVISTGAQIKKLTWGTLRKINVFFNKIEFFSLRLTFKERVCVVMHENHAKFIRQCFGKKLQPCSGKRNAAAVSPKHSHFPKFQRNDTFFHPKTTSSQAILLDNPFEQVLQSNFIPKVRNSYSRR